MSSREGGDRMKWEVCREIVGGILPMWRVRRINTGEFDLHVYGVQGDAIARMHELNAALNEEVKK